VGVYLQLEDFTELFWQRSSREPTIVNDVAHATEQQKEAFNRKILTTYSGDLLSNLPTCGCQKTEGESKLGTIAKCCGTEVKSHMDEPLEPLLWVRKPKGVNGLINPNIWLMLKKKFTRSGFEIIRYLTDTNYKPSVKRPAIMKEVEAFDLPRGLNNFIEHFDHIMNCLFSLKAYRPKAGEIDPLHQVLKVFKSRVFSDYLPVPNKALLVIEESTMGTYIDPIIVGAVDAVRMMVAIDAPGNNQAVWVKENRTVKMIAQLATYYEGLYKTTLAKKPGILRKHVFGSRSHFSFRAVISSLTAAHDYDEIHIPWGIAVSVLKLHLTNKLMRYHGFNPNQVIAFLNEHAQKHHPLLEQLFKELIAESPYKGIPCVMQRNPSLERGSAQLVFITTVKMASEIPTVSISILAVNGLSADFDGDSINFTLPLDINTTDALRPLAGHMSAFDLNAPRKVSRNLAMPKPPIATMASWMHFDEPLFEPEKADLFAMIPKLNKASAVHMH
jgi:hypothetical protein